MTPLLSALSIAAALLIGAISPGPSFVYVSQTALATSRRHGVSAAAGMGLGGAVFASLALLGLVALLHEVTWLYLLSKIAGGLYLLMLAARMWRGAHDSLIDGPGVPGPRSTWRLFTLAAVTQVSNPKTAVVYGSVFAALLPARAPIWLIVLLPLVVFAVEAGWYCTVAVALSAPRPRRVYLRYKPRVDRCAASVLGALGVSLAADAATATVT